MGWLESIFHLQKRFSNNKQEGEGALVPSCVLMQCGWSHGELWEHCPQAELCILCPNHCAQNCSADIDLFWERSETEPSKKAWKLIPVQALFVFCSWRGLLGLISPASCWHLLGATLQFPLTAAAHQVQRTAHALMPCQLPRRPLESLGGKGSSRREEWLTAKISGTHRTVFLQCP